ncbi:fungal-specific transcription factor domain-containing protein [Chytridium lagenaria]|nr:fungal-specific transcription factor domain-containing protein [Chytridium lagenaria]
MPIVHQKTFLRNFPNESPLLTNSMYALSARYSTHPSVCGGERWKSGDVFYIRAREMVDSFVEVPAASTVAALLCLASYAAGSGRGSASWMYSGMAIRMAQELKLNVEPELDDTVAAEGMSWLEKEKRRRIWWVCFIFDRYAGAAADRSMIVDERDCKIYLPSEEHIWASVNSYHDEPTIPSPTDANFQISVLTSTSNFTPGIQSHNPFGYFVLLTKVFGKIIDFTNNHKSQSIAALSKTSTPDTTRTMSSVNEMEMDYQLSVLDASLRNWYSSLPEWIQDAGEAEEFDRADVLSTNHERPTYIVAYLHIFYHTALILLYRPKMMQHVRDNPKTVLYSHAFSVCVSAAQSVSSVIARVAKTNPDFNFMTAFVAFLIFQAGLVHVMVAQVAGAEEGNGRDSVCGIM